MIFVTVGTQLPFDRMIRVIDDWAGRHPDVEVFAQIGPGTYRPKHMAFADFVAPARAEELTRQAKLIIAHAGMGSVLTALQLQRPILIVPRRASLGEHRNEHQLATARWLQSKPGITVAWDETELAQRLDLHDQLRPASRIEATAAPELIERLAAYINT